MHNQSIKGILPHTTHIGKSELYVGNITMMKDYYIKGVGLKIMSESTEHVELGKQGKTILALYTKEYPFAKFTDAGLYHNAILFSSYGELARVLETILQLYPATYAGSADHLVSNAFYFTDPEGNGLELYVDTPKETWIWNNNKIIMDSKYIDIGTFIQTYKKDIKSDQLTMGHVHVKIGNVQEGKDFYKDALGFDLTAELPGAIFLSAGGYHHHIGANTWQSSGAGVRENTLGLRAFEIITTKQELPKLELRLKNKNILYEKTSNTLTTHDPWNNKIMFKAY